MVDLNQKAPFIIRMVAYYGIVPVLLVSVLVILFLLLPLLIVGDVIVHGHVIPNSILSGLINTTIICPVFVYFFLRVLNELNVTKEKLSYMVIRDELTGVYNRRYIEQRVKQEFSLFKRHNINFGILLLDLDNFKAINDTYSHMAGDVVIKEVAKLCSNMLRESDTFARCGGEEFCCLVDNLDAAETENLANRINRAVEAMEIIFNKQRIPVTISIGVARSEARHLSVEDIMLSADKALYQAKQSGRNRVIAS